MTALTVATEPNSEMFGLTFLPKATPRTLAAQNPSGLREDCMKALSLIEPIKPHEFAVQFERMLVHYWPGDLNPQEGRILRADWLRLLGHLPADLMALGVDRYLLSTNRHKPTPGVFLELVAKDLSLRQTLARRAQDTLALLKAGRAA